VEILKKAAQRDLVPGPIFSKARNQRSIFSDSDIYQSVLSPLSRISSSHNSTKPYSIVWRLASKLILGQLNPWR